ncbi:pro-MCH isoform X2 [Lissotriton helveticus]
MLLDTISLGKAFRSGDTAEKSMASPLEHFKNEDSSFLDEDEERLAKNLGQKHTYISHSGLPLDLAKKHLPYLALTGPVVFPSDSEGQNMETEQERRDAGDEDNSAKLPIGRRDFDMLRCMLGRVYRPCWQI